MTLRAHIFRAAYAKPRLGGFLPVEGNKPAPAFNAVPARTLGVVAREKTRGGKLAGSARGTIFTLGHALAPSLRGAS